MDAAGEEACKVKNLRKTRLPVEPDNEGDENGEYNRFKPDLLAEKGCGNRQRDESLEQTDLCDAGDAADREPCIPEDETAEHRHETEIGEGSVFGRPWHVDAAGCADYRAEQR